MMPRAHTPAPSTLMPLVLMYGSAVLLNWRVDPTVTSDVIGTPVRQLTRRRILHLAASAKKLWCFQNFD
jgi:hypothetical protein